MNLRSAMAVPRYLYKYCDRGEHAEAMCSSGEIHLGTLHGYRAEEELGAARGDGDEGTAVIRQFFDRPVDITRPEHQSPLVKRAFEIGDGAHDIVLDRCLLTEHHSHPDVYIYCMSGRYNRRIWEAFRAVACVRIDRPRDFLDALVKGLREQGIVAWGEGSRCRYEERTFNYTEGEPVHAGFLKATKFSYQAEFRARLHPVSLPIEPRNVSIPELARYCTIETTELPE